MIAVSACISVRPQPRLRSLAATVTSSLPARPAVAEGVHARCGPVERQGLLDVDAQCSAFAISCMRVVSVSRFGTAMTVVR